MSYLQNSSLKFGNTIEVDFKEKDNVIGKFRLKFNHETVLTEICIEYIEIFPEFRNKGNGKILLNDVINLCRFMGIKIIYLFVGFENENAIKLYRSCGFSFSNEIPLFNLIYVMVKEI
jgi:ribosomal protein S18 acetylase RimI-like enzyme